VFTTRRGRRNKLPDMRVDAVTDIDVAALVAPHNSEPESERNPQ